MAMTKDQIDELMRENGIVIVGEAVYALCNLVEKQSAAEEREACAKLCDELADDAAKNQDFHVIFGCESCAEKIRARGQ